MKEGRASLVDVRCRAQVRTYRYPFTYTFYSIEHFLDAGGFHVRLSDISRGLIMAHFDGQVTNAGGRRGFVQFTIEPTGDDTHVKLVSDAYSVPDDGYLVQMRISMLRGVQEWLDGGRTMSPPSRDGGIPRFREGLEGRMFMERPTRLQRPDGSRMAGLMLLTGWMVPVTGIPLVLALGLWPLWALVLVVLCGLPFIMISRLIDDGWMEEAVPWYGITVFAACLTYLVLTAFVGFIFILVPVAMVLRELQEYQTWDRFYWEQHDERFGSGSYHVEIDLEKPNTSIPRPGIVY